MIEKRIKERFGTKAKFCAKCGHKPKELATKLRTLRNKIKWVDTFLAPLGLRVTVGDDGYETRSGVIRGVNTERLSSEDAIYADTNDDLIGDATPPEPQGLEDIAKAFEVTKGDDLIGVHPCCKAPADEGHERWCSGTL